MGQKPPVDADPTGEWFCFEKGAHKDSGGEGRADVWKKGCFAWEYKGKDKDLDQALSQLKQYREALENPPLLIVCDLDEFRIHTNFQNTAQTVYSFRTPELAKPRNLEILRNAFETPEALNPRISTTRVTEEAAQQFSQIADSLRERKVEPLSAAHFLMKMLFCLFAEDVGLLRSGIFERLLKKTSERPEHFKQAARGLFEAMREGGLWGDEVIHHFDGGLFADAEVLDLTEEEIHLLAKIAEMDWGNIEPAIFGTLFERSLDPDKRQQLGAHYTSEVDIRTIVEPVLMAPLRREWGELRERLEEQLDAAESAPDAKRKKAVALADREISTYLQRLRSVRVLDPACGSGNFLYVSLKLLKDLEKEVIEFAGRLGKAALVPFVQPDQLYGIEKNAYARELASVVVWIGYIQWYKENGHTYPTDPVLKPLNNIEHRDAILDLTDPAAPKEPEWPEADVIVSNPPFLGGKLLRGGLRDEYVDALFRVYDGRVPREADLVLYWFEKARQMLVEKRVKRVGLLGTQGIRGGANRRVLERIKETGDIFFAISDREWALDGAMVHVSMVGFDGGVEKSRALDARSVNSINADLSTGVDLTETVALKSNVGISFMGDTKGGKFDIPKKLADQFLAAPNPNRRPNRDVVRPWVNGRDLLQGSRGMYIIDFGIDMPCEDAAQYEAPFEHVKSNIKPLRDKNKRDSYRERWWIHVEPRPAMRAALAPLKRYIATPTVSKHRIFVWMTGDTLPDHQLIVFACEGDYTFGVLHSRVHEVWSRRRGTQLREASSGSRYTPTTTFETFPFPWPLGKEPRKGTYGFDKLQAIADAARELVEKRDAWLKPVEGSPKEEVRTLTGLYNKRPTWLADAHAKLDRAVLSAYGWADSSTDTQLLERLLALNRIQSSSDSAPPSPGTLAADGDPRR